MNLRVKRMGTGDMQPPEGPVELYRRSFGMHRYVEWEPSRQLWQVRQLSPVSGKDERIELVFWYDVPHEDVTALRAATGLSEADARALMVKEQHPGIRKVYRPFDYRLVRERLQNRQEFLRLGTRRYNQQILDANESRWQQLKRHIAGEMSSGFKEIGRWLPVLGAAHEQKRQGDPRPLATIIEEHKDKRAAMVAGGVTFG